MHELPPCQNGSEVWFVVKSFRKFIHCVLPPSLTPSLFFRINIKPLLGKNADKEQNEFNRRMIFVFISEFNQNHMEERIRSINFKYMDFRHWSPNPSLLYSVAMSVALCWPIYNTCNSCVWCFCFSLMNIHQSVSIGLYKPNGRHMWTVHWNYRMWNPVSAEYKINYWLLLKAPRATDSGAIWCCLTTVSFPPFKIKKQTLKISY